MIHVAIHPSQFPDRVRAELLDSFRRREIKHKFHYETYRQARKWLAVHEAYSPAQTDAGFIALYDKAFSSVAEKLGGQQVHVVGLGCGAGHKDAALAAKLKGVAASVSYTAVDVSVPLVIAARERLAPFVETTRGVVCDLETVQDLRDELCDCAAPQRIFTFFGLIPNSESDVILGQLRRLLGGGDSLLLNANLAPGADYRSGVEAVLPQYDNGATTDWLMTFLEDLGIERRDGEVQFSIEECTNGLLRIRADFVFSRLCRFDVEGERFEFKPGDKIRLFYSYRYTPGRLREVLARHGLRIGQQWLASSGEEGIFYATA